MLGKIESASADVPVMVAGRALQRGSASFGIPKTEKLPFRMKNSPKPAQSAFVLTRAAQPSSHPVNWIKTL